MEFKPKDWVLARDDEKETWKLDIFSHFADGLTFPYRCVGSYYSECIPFEGNEALLGTKDEPKEKKTGEWKVGDKVEVEYDTDKKWYGGEIVRIDPSNRSWVDSEVMPYYVRSECFKYNDGCAWCAARQLRKPGEKPDEEGWRPKEGEAVEALVDDEWQAATLILDDYTDRAPYLVRLQNGDKAWCTEEHVRPAQKEPFKFGDRVEANINDEWREGIFLKDDGTDLPYKIATPDGGIFWREKKDVRRA